MSELPETIEGLEDLAVQYFKKTDNPDAQYFTISDFLLEARKQAFKEVLKEIEELECIDVGESLDDWISKQQLRASIKEMIK